LARYIIIKFAEVPKRPSLKNLGRKGEEEALGMVKGARANSGYA